MGEPDYDYVNDYADVNVHVYVIVYVYVSVNDYDPHALLNKP